MDSFTDDVHDIPDSDVVFRCIAPGFVRLDDSRDDGLPKLPSQGFQYQPADVAREKYELPGACLSVGTSSLLTAAGLVYEDMLEHFPGYYIAYLAAAAVRNLVLLDQTSLIAQGIMKHSREGQPWHAVVWSATGTQTKAGKRAMAAASDWAYVPGVGCLL